MRANRAFCLLGAAALAGFLLIAPTSASATVLCQVKAYACPTITTYGEGTAFSGALQTATVASFETSAGTVKCKESTVEGKTLQEEAEPLGSEVVALKFAACALGEINCTITAEKLPYGGHIAYTEVGSGTLTAGTKEKPLALHQQCGFLVNCTYGNSAALSMTGGTPTTLAAKGVALKAESGTSCPEKDSYTATYALASPNEGSIYVAQQRALPNKLCSGTPPTENALNHQLRCTGPGYSGELKGELSSGVTEFESPSEPTKKVTCNETTYVGKFKEDGGPESPGGITALTFSSNVGGTPGQPCSSTFNGSPSVKITVENLPFSNSTVVYQKVANPQGLIVFSSQPTLPFNIKFEVNSTPAQTCKYEQKFLVTGEWLNGAGTNPSLINPLVGLFRQTSGGSLCPADMKLTTHLTVRGANNALVYVARE